MFRSMLFLPGNSPNMIINAAYLGADAVIFDLEDAVSPDEKDSAAILVRNALKHMDLKCQKVVVRVNPVDTEYFAEDIKKVVPCSPDFILLPKVNSAEDVRKAEEYIAAIEKEALIEGEGVSLIVLIETALGVENSFGISASSKRVKALLLGAEDLTSDLQCTRTKEGREIEYARCRLVMAARSAGIEVYDTPFTDVNDDEGIYADATLAKALGFSGKAAISPRHVGVINEVFSPSLEEIDYAYEVMNAIDLAKKQGKGAIALKGKMIDAPIVARAKRIIDTAEKFGISVKTREDCHE